MALTSHVECKVVVRAPVSRESGQQIGKRLKARGAPVGQESADPSIREGVEQRRVISIKQPGEQRSRMGSSNEEGAEQPTERRVTSGAPNSEKNSDLSGGHRAAILYMDFKQRLHFFWIQCQ